jgi:hypothetical protein
MSRIPLFGLGLALLAAASLLVGCQALGGDDPIEPPERLIGPFAFADEAGRLSLELTAERARAVGARAVYDVTGTLTVNLEGGGTTDLAVSGTYDDSDGTVEASGEGEVDGLATTYEISGTYTPGTGFTGTISRTRDGETKTGTVAAIGAESEGELEVQVFTGVFGATATYDFWLTPTAERPDPLPPPDTTDVVTEWDLAQGQPMGAFCFSFSDELIMGVYRNYPEYDEDELSGVLFGQFTDPPANTHFDVIVDDSIFATGTVAGDNTSGTWYQENWIDPWFDEGEQLWVHRRQILDGTFTGTLVQ